MAGKNNLSDAQPINFERMNDVDAVSGDLAVRPCPVPLKDYEYVWNIFCPFLEILFTVYSLFGLIQLFRARTVS